ncbi:RHOMBOID-like protein 8 [Cucurbita pepo subsp. pepo]|uniref:RHOMBOID-like protein 8 n=1 Tax=Cucurbita pepo subsp. pepo TaxID=3664 RepID=UPI000C9D2C0F|nr:RHOMBOID-like protein 8 [Cucurbita pepo subsp. pepo]
MASGASDVKVQIPIKPPLPSPPSPPSPPPPPPPPPFSTEFSEKLEELKIPFFKSSSRRPRGDTCVVSVFVLLHIVAFIAMMLVNDCWSNSHQECAFGVLGRMSFQPLAENPLLGPSASTLEKMGGLGRKSLTEYGQIWRLFTFPCMHAGLIHLVINLSSVIFVGIQLEHEYGPVRTGIIYLLSAYTGTLVAALFVQNSPSVGSSGALFGLLGAMLSGIIRNWKLYSDQFLALGSVLVVLTINFGLGLLPYIDNFANVGGLASGLLLGFMILFTLQHRNEKAQTKGYPLSYSFKNYFNLKMKQKLDKPILRSTSLLLFALLFFGCLVGVIFELDLNQYCIWCRYIDCIPFKKWHCKDVAFSCATMVSDQEVTLTCLSTGNFKVYPFTDISQSRINDLCGLICS